MRELATVAVVEEIIPIPKADRICQYRIRGWKVVDQVGRYQVGDPVIFAEVDSWIPHELAPFLSKDRVEPRVYNGVPGAKLKTIRLRKALSQGLLLPVQTGFGGYLFVKDKNGEHTVVQEGDDVTEILGIQKWEPPEPVMLAGQARGGWPGLVQKTDQERIQNLTHEWDCELQYHRYEITEKLEGSSMTAGLVNNDFVVCSRKVNLRETEGNTFWAQARRYEIEEKMRALGLDNIVVQGELVGSGIQGNIYNIQGHDFYLFGVLDLVTGQYYLPAERRKFAQDLGLKHVPVIMPDVSLEGTTPDQLLLLADGVSVLADTAREGIVLNRVDGPEHLKAVSNKYLENEE